MSGSLLNERFIAVNPSLIRAVGLIKAVVIQEIHFASSEDYIGGESGQVTMGQAELADRIGLERQSVNRALRDLTKDGLVVAVPVPGERAKKSYSVDVEAVEMATQMTCPKVDTSPRPVQKRTGDLSTIARVDPDMPPYREEGLEENPPTPQRGEQEELFAAPVEEAAPKRSIDDEFYEWWDAYPRGKRGARSVAADAYAKRRKHLTADELLRRLSIYVAARQRAKQAWGGEAPLMHGASFLNRRHDDWVEPLTDGIDERLIENGWQPICERNALDGNGQVSKSPEVAAHEILVAWQQAGARATTVTQQWRAMLEALEPQARALAERAGPNVFTTTERDALFALKAAAR